MVFSLVEFYLLLARDHKIGGYNHTETRWADIGNSDTLAQMQMIRPEDYY
jgi:NDP-sugar pyrophosphorylase family protein